MSEFQSLKESNEVSLTLPGALPESVTINGVQYVRTTITLTEEGLEAVRNLKAIREVARLAGTSERQAAWMLSGSDYPYPD